MTDATSTQILSPLITQVSDIDPYIAERLTVLDAATRSPDQDQRRKVATIELSELFDTSAFEQRAIQIKYGRAKFLGLFEWFRNVLVLIPITLTWYGLSQAANNYNVVISQFPDLVNQPF